MLANFSIGIMWLPFIVIISALMGFSFRSLQIGKSRKRIIQLEREMLDNHSEILHLQKELAEIEKNNNLPYKSRVVPMKETPQPEGNTENPDTNKRKKLNK